MYIRPLLGNTAPHVTLKGRFLTGRFNVNKKHFLLVCLQFLFIKFLEIKKVTSLCL